MSSQPSLRPDPMPLREALRGLRHLLRRGGETLRDTVSTDVLPAPAADLAHVVFDRMETLARGVDEFASGIAKSVLGGAEPSLATFGEMVESRDADALFSAAVYAAVRAVLRRLGAPGAFVSEAGARSIFARSQAAAGTQTVGRFAATLTIAMLDARIIRGPTAEEAARVPGAALQPVAIFAVMLWLQSSRSDDENEAALDAATDLAVALAADVAAACTARDVDRIEALFAEFVAHV